MSWTAAGPMGYEIVINNDGSYRSYRAIVERCRVCKGPVYSDGEEKHAEMCREMGKLQQEVEYLKQRIERLEIWRALL